MLTGQDVYRYFQCPHWPYWERFGNPKDRQPLSDSEERDLADGLSDEGSVIQAHLGKPVSVGGGSVEEREARTLDLMKRGAALIVGGRYADGDWAAAPTGLLRAEGESALGGWYYIPFNVRRVHALRKEHKIQLAMAADLLEKVQGRFPQTPFILNKDGERLEVSAADYLREWREVKLALERIRDGEMPPPVYRKACEDVSPWGKACFRLASERNDIALIYGVDVKKLNALRQCNVLTVDDAADMDVSQMETCATETVGATHHALEIIKWQAQSLRNRTVLIREPFDAPIRGEEIFFDIESHPTTDTDYLYGFLLASPAGRRNQEYHAITAAGPESEPELWKSFLLWLESLPSEYVVYHFGDYEPTRLNILARRYHSTDNPWLARFLSRLVDLNESVRDILILPLYFYSLKSIARFLGFSWRGEIPNGRASIGVYEQWLSSRDPAVWSSLLDYNEDDVRATAFLLAWLKEYAEEGKVYAEPYPWENKKSS